MKDLLDRNRGLIGPTAAGKPDWRREFVDGGPTLPHELYSARRLAGASARALYLRPAGPERISRNTVWTMRP